MNIPAQLNVTGKEAWKKIELIAQEAAKEGVPVSDKIAQVLTDLEMPEMDGFTLTRLLLFLSREQPTNTDSVPVALPTSNNLKTRTSLSDPSD